MSDAALVSLDLTREVSDGGSSKRVMENDVLFRETLWPDGPETASDLLLAGDRRVALEAGRQGYRHETSCSQGLLPSGPAEVGEVGYEGSNVVPINKTRNKGKAGSES